MVLYCGLSSEVRRAFLKGPQDLDPPPETSCDFLNFRVVQWQKNLPAKLQFRGVDDKFDPTNESRGEYKLRLILYLRANQMRIVIYRNSMVQTERNVLDQTGANVAMEVAQDTVRVLVGLARTTDIYQTQHKTFNHFLEAALSTLLLTVCASTSVTDGSCLQGIKEAMQLVQRLSGQSPITQRLQDKLKGIHKVIHDLQLRIHGPQSLETGTVAGKGHNTWQDSGRITPRSSDEERARTPQDRSDEPRLGYQLASTTPGALIGNFPIEQSSNHQDFPLMDAMPPQGQDEASLADFDASQAFDLQSLRNPDLGDIFKDFDYFTF